MSPCHAEDADVFTSFPTSSLGTGHWEAPLHHFLNEKNEAFPNRVWEREEEKSLKQPNYFATFHFCPRRARFIERI